MLKNTFFLAINQFSFRFLCYQKINARTYLLVKLWGHTFGRVWGYQDTKQ